MQAAGAGLSIVGAGLGAFAQIKQAQGVKAGDEFKAASEERAAEYGRLKATQTGAEMTMRLNQTLGNIDAIRGASHDDPSSPTGAAFRDAQENLGNWQRSIVTGNILAQARQQDADAAYLRAAGSNALLNGEIGGIGSFFTKAGQAIG